MGRGSPRAERHARARCPCGAGILQTAAEGGTAPRRGHRRRYALPAEGGPLATIVGRGQRPPRPLRRRRWKRRDQIARRGAKPSRRVKTESRAEAGAAAQGGGGRAESGSPAGAGHQSRCRQSQHQPEPPPPKAGRQYRRSARAAASCGQAGRGSEPPSGKAGGQGHVESSDVRRARCGVAGGDGRRRVPDPAQEAIGGVWRGAGRPRRLRAAPAAITRRSRPRCSPVSVPPGPALHGVPHPRSRGSTATPRRAGRRAGAARGDTSQPQVERRHRPPRQRRCRPPRRRRPRAVATTEPPPAAEAPIAGGATAEAARARRRQRTDREAAGTWQGCSRRRGRP